MDSSSETVQYADNNEIFQHSDNNFTNFLASLTVVKTKQKDLEKMLLKNRNEQRTVQMNINKEKEKMKESAKKLKAMELRMIQLQQDNARLMEEHRNGEEL
jgi:septal ring factor EnvC (AmiA/AmiB activator)